MKTIVSFLFMLTLMTGLGWYTQTFIYLHGDVSYLTYASGLMSQGGQYGIDFFETNPPMILYYYLIPYQLSHLWGVNESLLVRLMVVFFIIYSALMSYFLLKRVIVNERTLLVFMFFVLLILYFVPADHFAQREHLFLILFLPYLFASACFVSDKKINPILACCIGLLAGLGLAIKPYFLAPLVAIELYMIVKTKRLFGWCRVESLMVLFVLVGYLSFVIVLHPTYLSILFPLVKAYYFAGIKEPWWYLLSKLITIFCLSTLIAYYCLCKTSQYKSFYILLLFAIIGGMITYVATGTSWFSHTIPAEGFTCLFFALVFAEIFTDVTFKHAMIVVLIAISVLIVPLYNSIGNLIFFAHEKSHSDYATLIAYLSKKEGEHSVVCFSPITTKDCFPLAAETKSTYASRYPFYWWLRGMAKHDHDDALGLFLVKVAADDLNDLKPRWVIINQLAATYAMGDGFDTIAYLSRFSSFQLAIAPYHHLKTIGKYDIYERVRKKAG